MKYQGFCTLVPIKQKSMGNTTASYCCCQTAYLPSVYSYGLCLVLSVLTPALSSRARCTQIQRYGHAHAHIEGNCINLNWYAHVNTAREMKCWSVSGTRRTRLTGKHYTTIHNVILRNFYTLEFVHTQFLLLCIIILSSSFLNNLASPLVEC